MSKKKGILDYEEFTVFLINQCKFKKVTKKDATKEELEYADKINKYLEKLFKLPISAQKAIVEIEEERKAKKGDKIIVYSTPKGGLL